MILFLHNRYRTTGGEERVVEDLLWLVREQLGQDAELVACDSNDTGRVRAAASLLRGGSAPAEVAAAVRRTGATVLHAHNLHPLYGWRALAAARDAGARVVLHLHQYRLVCAIGVCFTEGSECMRCHGRNTLPGVLHNCRGSRAEALSYAAALALWQRRLVSLADEIIVPSAFAASRLRALGAPLPQDRVHVLAPPLRSLAAPAAGEPGPSVVLGPAEARAPGRSAVPDAADVLPAGAAGPGPSPAAGESYALLVSRLAPEKGVDVAIEACARAGRLLLVAGDGPLRGELQRLADGLAGEAPGGSAPARLLGRVEEAELERLRAGAALALAPSRSAETFGLAAAESMAAGVPVLASAVGALPELIEPAALVPPGDPVALAGAIERLWADAEAGARARARVAEVCAPRVVALRLAEIYERAALAGGGRRASRPHAA